MCAKHIITKLFIIVFSLAVLIHFIFSTRHLTSTVAPDFRVYYQSAHSLITAVGTENKRSLSTSSYYPPLASLIFIPFAYLPYFAAQALFVYLSVISIVLSVLLSLRLANVKAAFMNKFFIIALTFLAFPVKFTLGMGQVNAVSYFLLLLGFYFYRQKKSVLSGVLIALAVTAKPALMFLLLFFFIYKAYRILLVTGAALAGLFLFTLLLGSNNTASAFVFYAGYETYYNVALPLFRSSLLWFTSYMGREVYYNQALSGFVSRLIPQLALRTFLTTLASGVFMGIISVLFYKRYKHKLSQNKNVVFALLLTVLVIVNVVSWQHHFIFLLFPFIVLLTVRKKNWWWWWGALIFAYIMIGANIKNPSALTGFPAYLLLSHQLYGAVVLLFLLLYSQFSAMSKPRLQ